MATVKTYELKEDAGGHVLRGEDAAGNPINRVMQGGERVKSAKPLDKLFVNKWVCLDDEEKKRKVAAAPFSEPVRPARLNRVATPALGEDEEEFAAPEVYDPEVDHTTDPDEEEKAEPRAGRLGMSKKTEKQKRKEFKKAKAAGKIVNDDSEKAEIAEDDDEETEPKEGEKAEGEPDGKDVTGKIKGAKENALRVFMTPDKLFNVFEADDLSTPLNSAPLTKKAAEKFSADYKG